MEWEVPAGQPGGSPGPQEPLLPKCGCPPYFSPLILNVLAPLRSGKKLLEIGRGSAVASR